MRSFRIGAQRAVVAGLLLLGTSVVAKPASLSAATKPPTDLSGSWSGIYDAGGDEGAVTLTFSQTGDAGTLSGTAVMNAGGTVTISGAYTMKGRKIAPGSTITIDVDNGVLVGKATKLGSDLKLKGKSVSGKGKITVSRSI